MQHGAIVVRSTVGCGVLHHSARAGFSCLLGPCVQLILTYSLACHGQQQQKAGSKLHRRPADPKTCTTRTCDQHPQGTAGQG